MPFLQCAGMERVRVRVELRPLQLREQLPAQPALPLQTQWGGGVPFPAPPQFLTSQSQESYRPPLRLGQGQASSEGELERPSHVTS